MRDEDVLLPPYRDNGALLWRGVKLEQILLFWGGDERGNWFSSGPAHDFPFCVPVGSQAPHAAGVAYAFKLVFVATNNQWAISVPLRLQTGSETLAQKAVAAGFTGEQVNGSDVVAMRAAAEEAIAAARDG
ncbi:thiamine pyrophosphate-dependent enzyme [Bradyrhizobium hipponense]|uniref:thiamine pyrophosphate-dependent enzyme n=1 Tax=Bradyrhizobium hipponense TaxID=2605638 RepID=UPI0024C092EC|nr:thiamine pyrophosphate-dependent enzyme [Bradyrhizobium hipponense]